MAAGAGALTLTAAVVAEKWQTSGREPLIILGKQPKIWTV